MSACRCMYRASATAALEVHSRAAPADCTAAALAIRKTCLTRPSIVCTVGRRTFHSCRPQQWGTMQQRRQCTATVNSAAITLRHPDGRELPVEKDVFMVGSSDECDLHVAVENVQPQHAQLERKGGRLFCVALTGDADELLSDTYTWLDGSQLRHGVAYLVAPGARLAFGTESQRYTLQFEEAGTANSMMEMLMKSMANQGSEEVRRQVENL